jgi:DnaJ-class molecular chaperone
MASIDLDALRAKYAALASERDATLEAAMAGNALASQLAFEGTQAATPRTGSAEGVAPGVAIDALRICVACNGRGEVSRLYNHMMLARTCNVCSGDGVVSVGAATTASESRDSGKPVNSVSEPSDSAKIPATTT